MRSNLVLWIQYESIAGKDRTLPVGFWIPTNPLWVTASLYYVYIYMYSLKPNILQWQWRWWWEQVELMLTRACRLKQLPGRSVHWLGRSLGRPILVSFEEIFSHSVSHHASHWYPRTSVEPFFKAAVTFACNFSIGEQLEIVSAIIWNRCGLWKPYTVAVDGRNPAPVDR